MFNRFNWLGALLCLCCFWGMSLSAQRLNHVQGDILIQLADLPAGVTISQWVSQQKDASGNSLNLRHGEELSAYMNIHRLTFDFRLENERILMAELLKKAEVLNVQLNHFVSLRETIPDDPEFLNQWQYINTGQNGGTPGADIDMELAWDFAQGGLTSNGDTIVVCVIDDGIDNDHPDIEPNLWVNHAEIPGNGVDDDNNGYVDDYRGWATGSDDDGVYDGGGHGSPVAGIVGAKGNNGIGVAGVNWHTKLMIVQGGTGVESEVLEAYGYPLEQRRIYNETAGEKGAFVVATNASWGVDFGDPADSPLWCAFYDSLGVQGIISCGATANVDLDVDVDGDLPTGCTSDYLISVTNITRNDVKQNGAAWGLENVDLGAFGAGTWTVSAGGGYGGFGGTSGATPHVTGTVALMYSLECAGFMALVNEDPGAAALFVKSAILDGVDPNESIADITVTGGRLNVHNTVGLMLNICGGCPSPIRSAAQVEIDTQAVLEWTSLDTLSVTDMRWRALGDTLWMQADSVDSPYTLNGLMGCTQYEYQLRNSCDTLMSEFGRSFVFETEGCCRNPEMFTLGETTDSTALLMWPAVFAAQSYQIQYRRVDIPTGWADVSTSEISFTFNGLESCGTYEYRFRLICSDEEVDFTDPQVFYTSGCGPCTDLEYCAAPDLSSDQEWISAIEIGDLVNISGPAEEGYANFTRTGPTATYAPFQDYQISLTPAFDDTNFDQGWTIWIDLNQDGDFTDEGEAVYQSPGTSTGTFTGAFNIPADALRGLTRMRVTMLFDRSPNNPCSVNDLAFGEIEDYCITIEEPQPCLTPLGLGVDTSGQFSDTTLFLSWASVGEVPTYTLQYRELDSLEWNTLEVADTSQMLADLNPCSIYEVQIQTNCYPGYNSDFSPPIQVQTACPSSNREFLSGLDVFDIFPNPSNGLSRLNYRFTTKPDQLRLIVHDQLGRQVLTQDLVPVPNLGRVELDLTNLAGGVYYLRLVTEEGSSVARKLVKW